MSKVEKKEKNGNIVETDAVETKNTKVKSEKTSVNKQKNKDNKDELVKNNSVEKRNKNSQNVKTKNLEKQEKIEQDSGKTKTEKIEKNKKTQKMEQQESSEKKEQNKKIENTEKADKNKNVEGSKKTEKSKQNQKLEGKDKQEKIKQIQKTEEHEKNKQKQKIEKVKKAEENVQKEKQENQEAEKKNKEQEEEKNQDQEEKYNTISLKEIREALKTKVSKTQKKSIVKEVLINIGIAILMVIYLVIVLKGSINIGSENFEKDLKIMTLCILAIGIIILEVSYKKDSTKIALHGVEVLVFAGANLFLIFVNKLHFDRLPKDIMYIGVGIGCYYVIKSIVLAVKSVRKYKKDNSDIKEIVSKKNKEDYAESDNL